jgi:small subunit ribosomal protein S11
MATRTRAKKAPKKNIVHGVAHIRATFNNTLIMIADPKGNAVCWSSAGRMGFRGSKKGTSYAAQKAALHVGQVAVQNGVKSLDVCVKGPGAGRESAIRAFEMVGIRVTSIRDTTGVPHNGCRPRKRRRV